MSNTRQIAWPIKMSLLTRYLATRSLHWWDIWIKMKKRKEKA